MFETTLKRLSSKAALGLTVTLFVASACSHKDIKEDKEAMEPQASIEQETPPAPVFATEPESTFEETKTPEPVANPYKSQKIAKHKTSKKSSKKHHIARRHKKVKKIAKNHKIKKSKEIQPVAAAGSVSQLPPPPPPPAMPPQLSTPPNFVDSAQLSPVASESSSIGYQWLYIGTAFAIGLGALGYRYRGKFQKKSRRLIFNS